MVLQVVVRPATEFVTRHPKNKVVFTANQIIIGGRLTSFQKNFRTLDKYKGTSPTTSLLMLL
jgi:hypothetical protein